jgi:hypothetical protein
LTSGPNPSGPAGARFNPGDPVETIRQRRAEWDAIRRMFPMPGKSPAPGPSDLLARQIGARTIFGQATPAMSAWRDRFGTAPGGPLGSSFAAGDVMADVRRRRAEQDADRARTSVGSGYTKIFLGESLAKAVSSATVIGGAHPTRGSASQSGGAGLPGWIPGRSYKTAFGSGGLPAGMGGLQGMGDGGSSGGGPPGSIPPVPGGYYYRGPGGPQGPQYTNFRVNHRYARQRHNWSKIFARHAQSFGGGFGRGAKGFSSYFSAGYNATGSRKAWNRYQRRNRTAGARFTRGASQAFGSGSSTFQRAAGAGMMAGAGAAGTAGIAGMGLNISQSVAAAIEKGREFAEVRLEANRRFMGMSAPIAGSFANLGIGDFKRTFQTAHENEASIVRLTNSVNGMRDEFRPLDSLATAIGNRAGSAASLAAASAMRAVNPTIEWANRGINAADPQDSTEPGWFGRKLMTMHALGAGISHLANHTTGGLVGTGGANIDAVMRAASKKEHDAQVKANGGDLGEIWNNMIRMGWPDHTPFIPPRVPRPPRPAMGGIRPKQWQKFMP